MVEFRKRSVLEGIALTGSGGKAGQPGVTLRVVHEFAAIYIIARKGKHDEVLVRLSEILAQDVVDLPKRVAYGKLSLTGLSPGQWRAIGRGAEGEALIRTLAQQLSGLASVVDQGDGLVLIEAAGVKVRRTLAKGIPIDVHERSFLIGDAAQTSAFHLGLHVALIDAAPTFEIVSAASTARDVWVWLTHSAAEFGYNVV